MCSKAILDKKCAAQSSHRSFNRACDGSSVQHCICNIKSFDTLIRWVGRGRVEDIVDCAEIPANHRPEIVSCGQIHCVSHASPVSMSSSPLCYVFRSLPVCKTAYLEDLRDLA
jgi:hypothetical protein